MQITSRRITKKLNQRTFVDPFIMTVATAVTIPVITALCYFPGEPNKYLIRTGFGIKDIKISKKGFILPIIQSSNVVKMHPQNYEFKLHAMSCEKIPFILPGFFTIGPKNDNDSLIKYARAMVHADINQIILGIIEGETRTLSSQMTMEQIFNDRQIFKDTIIKGVQEELDQFGLQIFNANIKELLDSEESKYFYNMMQQKASSVENQAKIAVSEANKQGNIGQKEREAMTRREVALLEAHAIQTENEANQSIQISNRELAVISAENQQKSNIAQIESTSNSSIREYELQQLIEQKRFDSEIIRSKADTLPDTIVEADAIKIKADAHLYAEQQKALGILSVYEAQSNGVTQLRLSFDNDLQKMIQYLMLNNHLYEKIAEENAKALQGLQPKITMFTNGSPTDQMNPVQDLLKMSTPVILSYLDKQMGLNKE